MSIHFVCHVGITAINEYMTLICFTFTTANVVLMHVQIGPNSTAAAAAAARKTGVSYKDAGVDIDAGNALVEVCNVYIYIFLNCI
jgi:hypothetical protein